jgi:hypothetical protein
MLSNSYGCLLIDTNVSYRSLPCTVIVTVCGDWSLRVVRSNPASFRLEDFLRIYSQISAVLGCISKSGRFYQQIKAGLPDGIF